MSDSRLSRKCTNRLGWARAETLHDVSHHIDDVTEGKSVFVLFYFSFCLRAKWIFSER